VQRIHETIQHLAVPLDDLTLYPGNARQGDIGALSESLRLNGQYRPVVANRRTSHVLAGNHTVKAAGALGWDEIAVTWVDVDDEHAARIVIADNRASDLASYDDGLLLAALEQLPDLDGTLYDSDDVDRLRYIGSGPVADVPPDDGADPLAVPKQCPSCGFEWR
jgi:hypothetical protein